MFVIKQCQRLVLGIKERKKKGNTNPKIASIGYQIPERISTLKRVKNYNFKLPKFKLCIANFFLFGPPKEDIILTDIFV